MTLALALSHHLIEAHCSTQLTLAIHDDEYLDKGGILFVCFSFFIIEGSNEDPQVYKNNPI